MSDGALLAGSRSLSPTSPGATRSSAQDTPSTRPSSSHMTTDRLPMSGIPTSAVARHSCDCRAIASPTPRVTQHGRRIATKLSVYAAWVEGTLECDLVALHRAMGHEQEPTPRVTTAAMVSVADPLRTGWGGKSASLTTRVRVDPAAFGIKEPARDTRYLEESRPKTLEKTYRVSGQKSATRTQANAGRSLKRIRKAGGADRTRKTKSMVYRLQRRAAPCFPLGRRICHEICPESGSDHRMWRGNFAT